MSHGYGEPKLGESDIMEKNWSGEDVTEDDPSSWNIGAIEQTKDGAFWGGFWETKKAEL